MKSILDPSFRYTRSDQTDLRKTFARVRRDQLHPKPVTVKVDDRASQAFADAGKKVTQLRNRKP